MENDHHNAPGQPTLADTALRRASGERAQSYSKAAHQRGRPAQPASRAAKGGAPTENA